MATARRISKKVLYSLTAVASCAVITCATVLCFVFLGNGSPTAKAGTINLSNDALVTSDFNSFSPFSVHARNAPGFPTLTTNRAQIINTDSAPGSPSSCLRFEYPAGWPDGYEPALVWSVFDQSHEQVFVQYSFKYSDNWKRNYAVDKQVYFNFDDGAGSNCFVYVSGTATDQWDFGLGDKKPNRLVFAVQGTTATGGDKPFRSFPTHTSLAINNGVWYTVKMYMKINSNGYGDFKMWVKEAANPTFDLAIDQTNIYYYDSAFGAGKKIKKFDFAPVWGGGLAGDTKSQTDYFYVDEFKARTIDFDNSGTPPAPTLTTPNILEHHFNTVAPFSRVSSQAVIDSTVSAPSSPGSCLRFTYNAGMGAGYSPDKVWYSLANLTEIWTEYSFMYSENFFFHLTDSKQMYWYMNGVSPDTPNWYIGCDGAGKMRMVYQMKTGWPNTTGARDTNTTFGNNFRVKPGVWYTVKTYAKINTGMAADGEFKMWIDGNLMMEYTDVPFLQSTDMGSGKKIDTLAFDPVFGGGGDFTKPATDHFYVDHIKISTADWNNIASQNPTAPSNIFK